MIKRVNLLNPEINFLFDHWQAVMKPFGIGEEAVPCFKRIMKHYSAPQRYYHSVLHLILCLEEFEQAAHLIENPEIVKLALFYHDAIYDFRKSNNEEKSAELADNELFKLGVPAQERKMISNLILVTKHTSMPKEVSQKLIMDVDLAILGSPDKVYEMYQHAVRQEYAWLDDTTFKQGRSKLLQSFLNRPSIYQTAFFKEKYELQARQNLQNELALMGL
jgi:predicted metal-dependent HD superfamily phosphohydrolase